MLLIYNGELNFYEKLILESKTAYLELHYRKMGGRPELDQMRV